MEPVDCHQIEVDLSFDGRDLDGGNELLLLIRQHMGPWSAASSSFHRD